MNNKKFFIIIVLSSNNIISDGYAQGTTKIIRKDNYSYEVFCEITFLNNVADKLLKFCWDMNNISKILTDEPVSTNFSEVKSVQTISYNYQVMIFIQLAIVCRRTLMTKSIIGNITDIGFLISPDMI